MSNTREIGIEDEDALTQVVMTNAEGYNAEFLVYEVKDGFVTLNMEPYSGILLVCNKKT